MEPKSKLHSTQEPTWSETFSGGFSFHDFHRTIRRDLKDLYRFYLDEEKRERLERMNKIERWFSLAAWLLKSLFLKLSPIRRFLLLVSLVIFSVSFRFTYRGIEFNFPTCLLGFLLLLLIFMLELKDKLLARSELELGRAVQLALLPSRDPEVSGWEIWLSTRPANDVGGDLVDYTPTRDGRQGIVLGDVAGKGLAAALLMAKLQATLRALTPECQNLPMLAAHVNRILCRDGLPNRFATLVFVEVTPGSSELRLVNAGHLPPVVLNGSPPRIWQLQPVAPPLGVMASITYEEQTITVEPGDLVVIFSDGLTEAQNSSGEFFGDDRLLRLFQQQAGASAARMGVQVFQEIERFVGDERPYDDQSLIILKRTP